MALAQVPSPFGSYGLAVSAAAIIGLTIPLRRAMQSGRPRFGSERRRSFAVRRTTGLTLVLVLLAVAAWALFVSLTGL